MNVNQLPCYDALYHRSDAAKKENRRNHFFFNLKKKIGRNNHIFLYVLSRTFKEERMRIFMKQLSYFHDQPFSGY